MAGVDFRGLWPKTVWPRRSPRGGGGEATDCAGVGFGAIRAGGFLPVEVAGSYKTMAGAYFRGRGACTQYDPKVRSGRNNRGHHFVWPAVCCSRGFVRALGFRVTLRATPVGSWRGLGLCRALRATSRGSFVNPVSLRGGSQRPWGSQNLRASNLVATQSADHIRLALNWVQEP